MKRVHIAASSEYDVVIGAGLFREAGAHFAEAVGRGGSVAIIAGAQVAAIYAEPLADALRGAGYAVHVFTYPGGEGRKTLATYEEILRFLSEKRMTRGDTVAALGGGTTGDVAGFAAATYQRGMKLVQLPTTYLAAVDSSVGGKTAVNLDAGKNQVGCFYQPRLVLCDTDAFATLPERERVSGMGEIVKYGVLGGEALFALVENADSAAVDEALIARCVGIKSRYVAADEFDTGARMLLNFGHTVGHAIEKCSAYTVPHGHAVAAGMAIISRAAAARGICGASLPARLAAALERHGLPTGTDIPAASLCRAALSDKKLSAGRLRLIVPEEMGKCRVEEIAPEALVDWLNAGGVPC